MKRISPLLEPGSPPATQQAPTLRHADTPSVTTISTPVGRCRNVDLLSIAYGLRPRLRPD